MASYRRRLLFLLAPLRLVLLPLAFEDFVLRFALEDFFAFPALVDLVLADLLLVGFLLVGFLLVDLPLAGFLLAGFLLAGFFLAGFFLVDFALVDEAFAFAVLPLFAVFFPVRLPLFPRFFDATEGFLLRRFAVPLFDTTLALGATAFTVFSAGGAAELAEAAARPANAPITPPTTAPTGPATLPRTAPAAAPAVCFEIGGISMFSDDELDESGDG